jgi:hypothetical protein
MRKLAFALGILLLPACTPQAQALADCPDEQEVHQSIIDYINKDYWSPGERDIWKVAEVDGFNFSAMQTAPMTQKVVEYNEGPRDVCPVRLTYSFVVHKQDGSTETTEMGQDKTFLFYKNPFGEWTFKVD